MLPELKEIGKARQRLGLTQKELAGKSGVSQSLIAKIESGKISPSYGKAKKLFEALEELQQKEEAKAKEIMTKKVIFSGSNSRIEEVIGKMKKNGISQVPIIHHKKVCGLITEKSILEKIAEGREIKEIKAEEIMEEIPPQVSPETSQRTILELLKESPIVLISEKGEIKGLISKSDILTRRK